jgi:subtilisin-like proprotein convertase family protein
MTLAGGLALAISTFALVAAPVAGATTYNNDTPITIPSPGTQGLGAPYQSSITVSGTAGPLTDVNVGLDGLSHGKPNDVAIALSAPSGQSIVLLDCAGDSTDTVAAFLTFDDAAAGKLPNTGALSTGTFQPTSHCPSPTSWPAPGPLNTYANPGPVRGGGSTFASTFNGLSPIGTWSIFVLDLDFGDTGSIPGGWSLDVKPDVAPLPAATTPAPTPTSPPAAKKCKKKKGKKKGCRKKPKKRGA